MAFVVVLPYSGRCGQPGLPSGVLNCIEVPDGAFDSVLLKCILFRNFIFTSCPVDFLKMSHFVLLIVPKALRQPKDLTRT